MPKNVNSRLKKLFAIIQDRKRLVLALALLFLIVALNLKAVKVILVAAIFIIAGGFSKIYRRFFRSTIGIDLVLFTTIMTCLVYRNLLLSIAVGFAGLVFADTLAMRFSHTTTVSYMALSAVILASGLISLPITISAIILTILFEIIASMLYFMMGSTPQGIALFLASHFLFNMFLILSFAVPLSSLMV